MTYDLAQRRNTEAGRQNLQDPFPLNKDPLVLSEVSPVNGWW